MKRFKAWKIEFPLAFLGQVRDALYGGSIMFSMQQPNQVVPIMAIFHAL